MNPRLAEVNAAVLAVLAEWSRPARRAIGRASGRDHRGLDIFGDRLLGVRQVEGLGDRGEVRVLAGTVVTPMARDLLKQRRIAVRVVSGREAALARTLDRGEWGFAIESPRNPGLSAALRRHWLDGPDWSEVATDAASAADWVAESEVRGALIVADEASVATWRAGRVEGIRSATVGDVNQTMRAIRHLGANVVVVEPASRSIHLIAQIADRFRAGGAPVAPEWAINAEWEAPR